jgi:hypothetical protein
VPCACCRGEIVQRLLTIRLTYRSCCVPQEGCVSFCVTLWRLICTRRTWLYSYYTCLFVVLFKWTKHVRSLRYIDSRSILGRCRTQLCLIVSFFFVKYTELPSFETWVRLVLRGVCSCEGTVVDPFMDPFINLWAICESWISSVNVTEPIQLLRIVLDITIRNSATQEIF